MYFIVLKIFLFLETNGDENFGEKNLKKLVYVEHTEC